MKEKHKTIILVYFQIDLSMAHPTGLSGDHQSGRDEQPPAYEITVSTDVESPPPYSRVDPSKMSSIVTGSNMEIGNDFTFFIAL